MKQLLEIHFQIQQLDELCEHLAKSFQFTDSTAASAFGVVNTQLSAIALALDTEINSQPEKEAIAQTKK